MGQLRLFLLGPPRFGLAVKQSQQPGQDHSRQRTGGRAEAQAEDQHLGATGQAVRPRRQGDLELDVETIRLSDPQFATAPYQGVVMVATFAISRHTECRSIPAGSPSRRAPAPSR